MRKQLFVICAQKCTPVPNGPIQISAAPASSCIRPKYLMAFISQICGNICRENICQESVQRIVLAPREQSKEPRGEWNWLPEINPPSYSIFRSSKGFLNFLGKPSLLVWGLYCQGINFNNWQRQQISICGHVRTLNKLILIYLLFPWFYIYFFKSLNMFGTHSIAHFHQEKWIFLTHQTISCYYIRFSVFEVFEFEIHLNFYLNSILMFQTTSFIFIWKVFPISIWTSIMTGIALLDWSDKRPGPLLITSNLYWQKIWPSLFLLFSNFNSFCNCSVKLFPGPLVLTWNLYWRKCC